MKHQICVEKGPNNYSAYSPDVPGCVATGKTRAEVERNLKSAIRFHLAEEIRQFAGDRYIVPARKEGGDLVEIRAGDVHKAMNLNNRMPAVCGALDTKLFRDFFNVELVSRKGPHQGANALFEFKIHPHGQTRPCDSANFNTNATKPVRQVPLAEQIRQFVNQTYIQSARERGDCVVKVRAGDVHREMKLNNRMPAVCGALETNLFNSSFGVELVSREGPKRGASALYEFHV